VSSIDDSASYSPGYLIVRGWSGAAVNKHLFDADSAAGVFSEMLGQTRLFEHTIGTVARHDLTVHWKSLLGYRAEPYCMIAAPWSYETTTRLAQ
jgi:hypothetical protein